MASYRTLDWVLMEPATDRVKPGDFVSREAGGMPIYKVEDVSDGRYQLRDERASLMNLGSLSGFRWRASTH